MSAVVPMHEDERVPVYVWDVLVRVTHWAIALSIVALSVSGWYIGSPIGGGDGSIFHMGTMRSIHLWGSIVFTVAVCARIAWMFVGTRWARWTQFVPTTKQRLRDLVGTARFYGFLRSEPPPATGHNALAGFAYTFVFLLYLGMIFTGFALYAVDASASSYMARFGWFLALFGGPQSTRWLHHAGMWVILVFVVQHVYSSILVARVERNGTIDSIFGGWKVVKKSHRE